ncbi:hypothetical protein Plhal304r1_c074g0161911 [Plasmopara halstedii]
MYVLPAPFDDDGAHNLAMRGGWTIQYSAESSERPSDGMPPSRSLWYAVVETSPG